MTSSTEQPGITAWVGPRERPRAGHADPIAWLSILGIVLILAMIAWHVIVSGLHTDVYSLTWLYTLIVVSYLLSRFVLLAFYRAPADVPFEPSIAIVVPAFNEGEAIARTIDAAMAVDYPADRIELVCVDDGSSDDTWEHMQRAAARYPAGMVRCIELGTNRGKRIAMAAGIRATSADVLIFLDSDCVPARDGIRLLVQGLADERVGAVAGLTYARNAETNLLTQMQAARYYISFQLLKAAESVVGAVACCSGCFAAYRREAVQPLLTAWEHQRFLGVECTYGDDRALSNMVIRNGWRTIYDRRAEAWTEVPDRYRKFFKQQLRWKKSWAREGPLLLLHLWKSRPLAFPSALTGSLASLLAPFILLLNLSIPLTGGHLPVTYLLGLYLVSLAYGLLYRALRNDGHWSFAIVGSIFYLAFSCQLWWAIARLRDNSWGTRVRS